MIDRCHELLNWSNIQTIYLVFDGKRVPLKAGTNAEREMKRQAKLEEARQLRAAGKYSEASEKYRSCVKGNDLMARVVAAEVERKWGRVTHSENPNNDDHAINKNVRVQCVWSPYEADAQLAKLCIDGYAHAVVTEDSDVLVYSAVTRQPFPIIYKLDRKDGSCDVITMDWLVNPEFLVELTGGVRGRCGRRSTDSESNSCCNSGRRRRSRRDNIRADLDFIYQDNSLYDEHESNHDNDSKKIEDGTDDEKVQSCCVKYEDLGFAPVRRTLPLPTSPSNGKATSTRNGSNAKSSSTANTAGNALLSYLRSFAYKEASNPGSGVRLFVQACILSGCDYVPNRLSKVGPVTAFKLVKEASHRDAAIRFERVLKSLPAGSKLLAEECDKSSEDGDGKDDGDVEDEDYDDFLSLPDTDRNAKENYEELLSKSESVFYYHLVREMSTGKVLPLVTHNQPTQRDDDVDNDSSERDAIFRPCITRFENGMTFVGTAAEAMSDRPEPLPVITGAPYHRRHRPAIAPQKSFNSSTNGGWISAKKHADSTRPVQKSFQRTDQSNLHSKQHVEALVPLTKALPKETPMQRYLVSTKTSSIVEGDTVKSTLSNETIVDKNLRDASRDNISDGKENHDHNFATTSSATNPFAALAYDISTTSEVANNKSMAQTSNHCATNNKSMMKSPFFSPVKFDYGLDTPQGDSGTKTKAKDFVEASRPADSAMCAILCGDHVDGEEVQPKQSTSNDIDANISFGVGLLPEPPRMNNFYSPDIQPGPRRISTSPPERIQGELLRGNCLEDVIEILDDDDDDESPAAAAPLFKTHQLYRISSVNKQPFKSPYTGTSTNKRSSTATSSQSMKKSRLSSSALLAGFARQQQTSNILKQKSRFFPPTAKTHTKQTQMSLNSYLTKKNNDKPNAGDGR